MEEFNEIESNKPDPVIKSFLKKLKNFGKSDNLNETDQIMSAIFLIAVLTLILPGFLSTNNKLKQFFK